VTQNGITITTISTTQVLMPGIPPGTVGRFSWTEKSASPLD